MNKRQEMQEQDSKLVAPPPDFLIEENHQLRSALRDLLNAIDAPEVTVSTVADETWSNVLNNARNALNGGVSQ